MVSLPGGTVHRPPRASRRSSFVKPRTAASRNGRARDVLNARFTAPCAVALVVLVASVGAAQAQTKPSVPTATEELRRSTEALARLVSPAVVQIFTTSYVPAEGVVARAADLITSLKLMLFIDSKLELSPRRVVKDFIRLLERKHDSGSLHEWIDGNANYKNIGIGKSSH
jgi:hypothetical protein